MNLGLILLAILMVAVIVFVVLWAYEQVEEVIIWLFKKWFE